MAVEIRPEPTPDEREAILRALAAPARDGQPSAWWQAGVREAVGDDEQAAE